MEQTMYQELVEKLLDVFQDKALRIVLYGSVARGENTTDSDIDIAVFVRTKVDPVTDDRLSEAVVDMNLKYDKVFSVIDIDHAVYSRWREVTPFYQNVDREGIVLWAA